MSKREWICQENIETADKPADKPAKEPAKQCPQKKKKHVRFASPAPLPQWQNRKAEHPSKIQKHKTKYKKIAPATNPSSKMARNGYFS